MIGHEKAVADQRLSAIPEALKASKPHALPPSAPSATARAMDRCPNLIPPSPPLYPSPLLCTTKERYFTWMPNKLKPEMSGESQRTASEDTNSRYLLDSSEDLVSSHECCDREQIKVRSER